MTMTHADSELTHSDHLLFGVGKVIVKVTSNHVDVSSHRLQVVKGLPSAQVPRAQNVLDSTGRQQLPELCWQRRHPMRNVQVTQNQHQLKLSNSPIPILIH
jgi:hypothetical protein